ncbi:MAG TPA: hypothetical protein VGX23_00625 [Actinocrinis sp.]|nr:hypothetical protein [Actinocrinis sp.]
MAREVGCLVRGAGVLCGVGDNGAAGVAAALLDPDDGLPLGSLAIAGLDYRLPDSALRRLAAPLTAAAREFAPQLAAVVGRHASIRQEALDVTIQDFLDTGA